MPIYEYRCGDCGHAFELLIRSADTPACPECGSEDLERQTSLPTVRSSGTRDLAMRAARKRDRAQGQDRMHEQLKYEESHDRHG
ncbi:MAG: zinc ribbon domain-containing protein [Gemmatimonadetes bacterium]|nr:zinc ribbon domain-containing protein [Gemmatimonadota bacterium]